MVLVAVALAVLGAEGVRRWSWRCADERKQDGVENEDTGFGGTRSSKEETGRSEAHIVLEYRFSFIALYTTRSPEAHPPRARTIGRNFWTAHCLQLPRFLR